MESFIVYKIVCTKSQKLSIMDKKRENLYNEKRMSHMLEESLFGDWGEVNGR
jgi:hypothetical protein